MNSQRYRIVAIGEKSPNMLSEIINNLYNNKCGIETISSLRLGHSFVVVLMVDTIINEMAIKSCLQTVGNKYNLQLNVDHCTKEKYKFKKSDAFIRVKGNHEVGIKAHIISAFTKAGLDIHGLESDIYNKNNQDSFVINIKGEAINGLESLSEVAEKLQRQNIDVTLSTDWKLLV